MRSTTRAIRTAARSSSRAFEQLANLATRAGVEGARFRVHAPLIDWSKADIIRAGHARWASTIALTVSCYQADAGGRACGRCDSCRLRRAGFERAGVPDPTRYRLKPQSLSGIMPALPARGVSSVGRAADF